MKILITPILLLLVASCAPKSDLAKENAELISLTTVLTEQLEAQRQMAERLAVEARAAQQEAKRAMEMAGNAQEEAMLQAQLAREKQMRAQEEMVKLKAELEQCQ